MWHYPYLEYGKISYQKKKEEEEVRQKSSVTIIMSTNNDNDKQLNYRCVDNMEQSLHQ